MMRRPAPLVAVSTREERAAYVRERYVCMADCDMCGICASFHGKDPERALVAYIDGEQEYAVALKAARG